MIETPNWNYAQTNISFFARFVPGASMVRGLFFDVCEIVSMVLLTIYVLTIRAYVSDRTIAINTLATAWDSLRTSQVSITPSWS